MNLHLYPPPAHTLPERVAQHLLDRLTERVGKHVRNPPWRKNLPIYARVCFHEAAHALMCVENGVRILGVAVNPDSGSGYVSPGGIARNLPKEQRADLRAKIVLAGPSASALFSTVIDGWHDGCLKDLAVARVSVENGADFSEDFNASLDDKDLGDSWSSTKEVLRHVRDQTIAFYASSGWDAFLRSKDATGARFAELVNETCAWAIERREILLEVAMHLAYMRSKGGHLTGLNGHSVELAIKRVLKGHPASHPHRSSPEFLSWMIEQNRKQRENVLTPTPM
jgi:hypothetical protein